MSEQVISSSVWHEGERFLVSTIERDFDTYQGTVRGKETLVWKCDATGLRVGMFIFQGEGLNDHFRVCRELVLTGEIKEVPHE